MAADYWSSYASVSLVSAQHLLNAHREDRARGLSESQIQHVKAYFVNQIWELTRVCKLRYRVAATASVYFQRFYVRNSFHGSTHDPRLVHVGCVYLASKTEETLVQAKHLVVYAKRLQPTWPYDVKHLLDSEMMLSFQRHTNTTSGLGLAQCLRRTGRRAAVSIQVITQELDFMLVVYHAYRPLSTFKDAAGVPVEVVQQAWAALNDIYRCDAPLMYAPHVLAVGCVLYAWASLQAPAAPAPSEPSEPPASCGSPPWDCMAWLKDLNININEVLQVTEELHRVYQSLTPTISHEECKRLIDVARG